MSLRFNKLNTIMSKQNHNLSKIFNEENNFSINILDFFNSPFQ